MRRFAARESRCCGGGSRHLRVLRGGSFINNSRNARCAYRNRNNPDNRNNNVGFRVVLSTLFPRPELPDGAHTLAGRGKNGGACSWPRPVQAGPGE